MDVSSLRWQDSIKYDEKVAPVKTYCGECGHETGERQPHAKDCPCMVCQYDRVTASRVKALLSQKAGAITFRRFANIGTEAK